MTDVSLAPILVPIPRAAEMIGRGITFIYEMIGEGKIEAVKSDKRTLVKVQSLHDYVAGLPPAKIKPDMRKRRRRTSSAQISL
jgi:hypothetical protein